MHDPPGHVASMEVPLNRDWWHAIHRSPFARFSMTYAAIQFSVAVASPFFSVYMLRDLHFSYVQFMACLASTILMQFLTLNRWGRISDIFGNRVILLFCGFLIPFTPMLWLLSDNFWYLICIQAFGGFIWAGFNLSAGNFLYDLIPPRKRATYLAIHNVFASIGVFIGALLGGFLGGILPREFNLFGFDMHWTTALYHIFILSFVLRLLSASLLLPRIKEIRKVKPIRLTQLFFRVGRFSGVSGLNFDIIASRKKLARDA
jgi:MFS family permease